MRGGVRQRNVLSKLDRVQQVHANMSKESIKPNGSKLEGRISDNCLITEATCCLLDREINTHSGTNSDKSHRYYSLVNTVERKGWRGVTFPAIKIKRNDGGPGDNR